MVDKLVNSEANARRIALVESCFGSAGQPLSVPGRVLVGEGVLTKMCRKKPKPRQFFLFNDLLVYGNIIINKKKYNKQHIIPLEEVKLQSLEDEGQFRNGWLICTRGKSFAVYAATATEKQEWMAHINKCISDLLMKSGKKPSADHAAVWVPDAEASVCMSCKKSQFSLINRRHHCRKCGAVVCGACSSRKVHLPSQSSKPLRVCDTCFESLAKPEQNDNRPTGRVRPAVSRQDAISKAPSPSRAGHQTPPPRPPPPKLFGDDVSPEVPPSDLPSDPPDVNIPKRHPKMYELVSLGSESSSFWWDSVDTTDSGQSDRFNMSFESNDFVYYDPSKNSDSSGEDTDDDDTNGNIESEESKPSFYDSPPVAPETS